MASKCVFVALLRLPRLEDRSECDFRAVSRGRSATLAPNLSRSFSEAIRTLLAASAARAAIALPLPRSETLSELALPSQADNLRERPLPGYDGAHPVAI